MLTSLTRLVEFFSPWCHHCQAFAPTLQTLYEFYYASNPLGKTSDESPEALNSFTRYYDFNFAKVDCVASGDICVDKGVQSYPTLVLFKNGELVKKSTGAKSLKTASDYVEEILESIRPGSRPKEGVKLPEVGAHSVDTNAKPDEPQAKHKDPASGAAAGEAHNEKAESAPTAKPESDAAAAAAKPKTPPKPVNVEGKSIELTGGTFQKTIGSTKEAWFVKFYAPWCHHCQALAPNWAEMAREMKGKLNVAEVNCDVEKALCKNAKIMGFPTLKLFRSGEYVDYSGLRGVGDLVKYAKGAVEIGEGIKDVTATEFTDMEEKEEVIFTYFYDHATTKEDFTALDRLSLALVGKAKLVMTSDEKLISRFKITSFPRLMVSRDGKPSYYTALAPKDMRDTAKVLAWMKTVWLPLVPELTATNAREITTNRLVVLAVLSRDRADEFKRARAELKTAAKDWMDEAQTSFSLARQKARDAKQAKIDDANARADKKAWERAKDIRIEETKIRKGRKDVQFAWVDGVFWERWVKATYGVRVSTDGERVVVVDEDRHMFYPSTRAGQPILPDRHSILDTLRDVVDSPRSLSPQSTRWWMIGPLFRVTHFWSTHPIFSLLFLLVVVFGTVYSRRSRRGTWKGSFGGLNGAMGEVEKGIGGMWSNGHGAGLGGGKND